MITAIHLVCTTYVIPVCNGHVIAVVLALLRAYATVITEHDDCSIDDTKQRELLIM